MARLYVTTSPSEDGSIKLDEPHDPDYDLRLVRGTAPAPARLMTGIARPDETGTPTTKESFMSTIKPEVTASPVVARSVVLQPGEGRAVEAFGDTIQFKLGGEQTGGTLALGLDTTPPGGGPPLHYHRNEDELFLVMEGVVSYCVEGRWTDLGPGGVAYVPRGVVHTFRNNTGRPIRHWILATPSGFERYFERCAAVFSAPGAPDMGRIMEISREHGIVFPGPDADATAA